MASSEKQNNSFLLGLLETATTQENVTALITKRSNESSTSGSCIPSVVPNLSNAQTARSDSKSDQPKNAVTLLTATTTNNMKSTEQCNNLVNHKVDRKESLLTNVSDNSNPSTMLKQPPPPATKSNDPEDNREFLAQLLDNVTTQSQTRSTLPIVIPSPKAETMETEKTLKKKKQQKRKRDNSDYDALEAFYGTDDISAKHKKAKKRRGNKSKSGQNQQDQKPSLNKHNDQTPSIRNSSNTPDIWTVANQMLGRDPGHQRIVQDIYREAAISSNTINQNSTQNQQTKRLKRYPGKEPRSKDLSPLNKRVPCRFYKAGKCKEGRFCRFLHEGDSFRMVCRHFKTGSCNKGDDCNFSHDLSIEPCRFFHLTGKCDTGSSCPYSHAPLDQDLRRRLHLLTGPCKYYHLKGFCTNGEECLFSHDYLDEDDLEKFKSSVGPLEETNNIKSCTFFHIRGSCANSDKCTFSHAPITQEQKQELEKYVPKYDHVQ